MQPFFSFGDGILWTGNHLDPWIQMGVNFLSVLSIILWAGAHALAIFGTLHYFGMFRIDSDTEFHGSDITKHGEEAYPVTDWKKMNADTSTQTMLTMNCENIQSGKLSTKYKRTHPKKLTNQEHDYILMDNFHTILKAVNYKLSPC